MLLQDMKLAAAREDIPAARLLGSGFPFGRDLLHIEAVGPDDFFFALRKLDLAFGTKNTKAERWADQEVVDHHGLNRIIGR